MIRMDSSYVSIVDISSNKSKKIPVKFQPNNSYLLPYLYNVSCVKIVSEVENIDLNPEKTKMIGMFELRFGKHSYFLHGYYNLDMIDTNMSESYEDLYVSKISRKNIISLYSISFYNLMPLDYYETVILPAKRTYGYETLIKCIKFEYFHTKNSIDDVSKFMILFTDSHITFEFNFNWFAPYEIFKNYTPAIPIYIHTKLGKCLNLYIIELKRSTDKDFFEILNVIDFPSSYGLLSTKNNEEPNENFTLKNIIDYLV
ncbi:hypothetical protein LUQ84_000745 [Hamiltosporidium tvaerminnensis]|nr:hypothetical protein LUQ84_000745 [Hamiltosporidium tvaerminnensis]